MIKCKSKKLISYKAFYILAHNFGTKRHKAKNLAFFDSLVQSEYVCSSISTYNVFPTVVSTLISLISLSFFNLVEAGLPTGQTDKLTQAPKAADSL